QQGGPERYEEALRILERAGRLGIETRALHLRRAYFLDKLGKSAEAERARASAAALPLEGTTDHFLTGEELYRRGQWDDARAAFSRALTGQPTHFWARFFLGVSYLKAQSWAAAKEALNGCISDKPDFVWTYLFRSFANEKLQATAEAEAD